MNLQKATETKQCLINSILCNAYVMCHSDKTDFKFVWEIKQQMDFPKSIL